ncbi:hypothetical protein KQX54_003067 [Cotesia glomerata]|uniref:Uncharacterized protein n=1 Tax=Cotesia glomerata TaxID=32391 RepID=A0AAV7HVI0_COTGL|nr:hypothetical protein KQX54_003067 [Cotesia glomerata]
MKSVNDSHVDSRQLHPPDFVQSSTSDSTQDPNRATEADRTDEAYLEREIKLINPPVTCLTVISRGDVSEQSNISLYHPDKLPSRSNIQRII